MSSNTPAPRWKSAKTLCADFEISKPTLYDWIRNRGFPKGTGLGPNTVRWRSADVEEWEKQQGEVEPGEIQAAE